MMNGDLPPSSNDTGVRLAAASPYTVCAVAGEPVKATRSTSGCPVRGAPAPAPVPCTMLSTPGGSPASSATSPSTEQVRGAHSGGLRTTVLPAASAGPTRQVASMKGAFQGVDTATTPQGS